MAPPVKAKNSPPPKTRGSRRSLFGLAALITSTPFLIAIAIHGILLLLGGSIVLFRQGNPLAIFTGQNYAEPEGTTELQAPPSPEESSPESPNEPMTTETTTPSSEREETSEVLTLTTPSVMPSFPSSTPVRSLAPKATGLGSPGKGGGTGGIGTGPRKKPRTGKGSLFGFEETQENDLIGTMIDLKLDSTGKKPTGIGDTDTDFYGAVRSLLSGSRVQDGAIRKYFVVPKKLGATQIFIPVCDAAEAPKVFQVADKVKPNFWVIRYRGRFAAPVTGKYRFVGKADDLLWVAVDGKTVLEAHWDVNNFLTAWRPKDHVKEHSVYDFMEGNTEGDRERAFLAYGDWMNLEAGKPKDLEILLGEYGGGRFFAVLMMQSWEEENRKTGSKERPLIPLFVTAEPTGQQRQAMRSSKIQFPGKTPVFAADASGSDSPTEATTPSPSTTPAPPTSTRGDTASDPAYAAEWKDGSSAGQGFEPWILCSNDSPDKKSFAGFYMARQEEKSGSEPVATEGRSWALYADGEGFQEAVACRPLSVPLAANQFLSVDLVAPMPKSNSGSPGSVGLTLRQGKKLSRPGEYNDGARLELFALEGKGNYQILDGSQPADSGLPVSPAGLRVQMTLRTADTYDLKLLSLGGDAPVEFSNRRLGGAPGSPIESITLYNRDSEGNVFFNRLQLGP